MSRFAIYLYGPLRGPMPVDFETLGERLSELPHMFFEMDGSWVWTGHHQGHRWQLDGMVYDANGQVQYLDVKGSCPYPQWQLLLAACNSHPQENRPRGEHKSTPTREEWTVLRLPQQESCQLKQFEQEIWGIPE